MCPCPMGAVTYSIQEGDTLWKLAQGFNINVDVIESMNPGVNPENLVVGTNICFPLKAAGCNSERTFRETWRMLWEEHINWTRSAIVSIVFYTPDQDLVIKRLLRNPTDMGNVLQPFYGSEKASEFSNLLREHLVIAAQLVKATKAGNTTAAADAEKRWYANADQIAVFLASINPNWSRSEWIAMLHEHLALTKSEAVSMITKDYGAAVSILDTIERQALTMADVMAEGIIRQFPDKFPC